jgi:hypothetical protein
MLATLRNTWLAALGLVAVSWLMKGSLPAPAEIRSELRREPAQSATAAEPFTFLYRARRILVRPVATYELAGLVVSHNDVDSFADIYHDSDSVDTKDLCVIWGSNVRTPDYRRVRFSSGSFTCYYEYGRDVAFSPRAASNNHLITDNEEVRRRIAGIRVGDQVRLSGLLVDYRLEAWGDDWRRTSTGRGDDGCEVVFVRELEVLSRGTPAWYIAHRLGWILVLVLPPAYLVALHFAVARRTESSGGAAARTVSTSG